MENYTQVIAASITSLVTLIGFFVSSRISIRSMKQILDGSSEWRKSLFRSCSKNEIDMDDVHLLRTSLRYVEYPGEPATFSFNWFSNESIRFCDNLIAKKYANTDFQPEDSDKEIVRLIIRCLLKNHWEYSSRLYTQREKNNREENEVIRDTVRYIVQFTDNYFQPNKDENKDENKDQLIFFRKLRGKVKKTDSSEYQIKDQTKNKLLKIEYYFLPIITAALILEIIISFVLSENLSTYLARTEIIIYLLSQIINICIILIFTLKLELNVLEQKLLNNIFLYTLLTMIVMLGAYLVFKNLLITSFDLTSIIISISNFLTLLVPLIVCWLIFVVMFFIKTNESKNI